MKEGKKPDFIIAGTQKCATSWVHKCLREHPEIFVPRTDSVHFFDINYQKGLDWYEKFFEEAESEYIGETGRTYIRSHKTPQRIAETIGRDVKIIFCIRNPVDRAFSHYWHEKKKDKIAFEFDEVFENYDLFQNWIEPGFYYQHLQRFEKHFDSDNIKVMLMEDLKEDDEEYIQEIFSFIGADGSYQPSYLDDKVNAATGRWTSSLYGAAVKNFKRLPEPMVKAVRPVHRQIYTAFNNKSEYEEGMETETRERLVEIFENDIENLSNYLGRNLDHWLEVDEND